MAISPALTLLGANWNNTSRTSDTQRSSLSPQASKVLHKINPCKRKRKKVVEVNREALVSTEKNRNFKISFLEPTFENF
jgi:hypothetical protein